LGSRIAEWDSQRLFCFSIIPDSKDGNRCIIAGMETLAEYLDRLMRQQNLTPKALAKRCGLTDSYIIRIRNGSADNLTVETIVKLANGLEVNPHELFARASGVSAYADVAVDALLLLETMQRVAADPPSLEMVRLLMGFTPDERQTLTAYLTANNRPKGKGRPESSD